MIGLADAIQEEGTGGFSSPKAWPVSSKRLLLMMMSEGLCTKLLHHETE
nr:hypothetical protein [uncultured Cohaesibacter sp.]